MVPNELQHFTIIASKSNKTSTGVGKAVEFVQCLPQINCDRLLSVDIAISFIISEIE
jgi:hypothetical protein